MLSYFPSHLPIPKALSAEKSLEQTNAFWTQWTAKCTYQGPYEEAVKRSLVALKALTYWPTGGITAAATTSLPEKNRRRQKLGLPLLLVARCLAHSSSAAGRGLR
jgi:hypothetical protein